MGGLELFSLSLADSLANTHNIRQRAGRNTTRGTITYEDGTVAADRNSHAGTASRHASRHHGRLGQNGLTRRTSCTLCKEGLSCTTTDGLNGVTCLDNGRLGRVTHAHARAEGDGGS